jgi:hypothetical protein
VVEELGSALVYVGAPVAALGVVAATQPSIGALAALGLLGLGILAMAAGLGLPAREVAPSTPRTRLDAWMPAWQFGEVHTVRIHSSPADVFRAVKDVTAGEIRLFRALTWIRNPRRSWSPEPESILAAPADRAILDVALRSGFVALAEDQDREVVVGTVLGGGRAHVGDAAGFASASGHGGAKAGMNFLIDDEGGGWTRLTTETRVHAADVAGRRRFAAYWRAIYPGSAFIRRMWLRAIKARAEKGDRV